MLKTFADVFFCRIEGSISNLQQNYKIIKPLVLITSERMELIKKIMNEFEPSQIDETYNSEHMLTGLQGIGKSYTLLLMAQCLKLNNKFHVVMISECGLLSKNKWNYVISQFKLAFPLVNFNEIPGDKEEFWLKNFILDQINQKKIVIIIVDQINWVFDEGDRILGSLLSFCWTIIIVSESANNNVPEKSRYLTYEKHTYKQMIPKELIHDLIQQEIKDYNPIGSDLQTILDITQGIPREALLLCMAKGTNLEEKIYNFQEARMSDFDKIHSTVDDWVREVPVERSEC